MDRGKKQKSHLFGLEHGVQCRVQICSLNQRRMFEQSAPNTRGALMLKMKRFLRLLTRLHLFMDNGCIKLKRMIGKINNLNHN